MFTLSLILTRLFDLVLMPFGGHRSLGLAVVSVLAGAVLALVYRATSNALKIRRTREVFKARVLEMRLYPDDIVLITRALVGAVASQGDYLRAAARPILIVAVVAVPVFLQLEARYARAPLAPGGSAIVTARLKSGLDPRSVPTELTASRGVRVDARSVRAPASGEIAWSIYVEQPGRHAIELRGYDLVYRFDLSARRDARALGRERAAHSPADALLHPGLPRIGDDAPFARVSVTYPEAHYLILGARLSWLTVFLVGTMAGALVPARLLRVPL